MLCFQRNICLRRNLAVSHILPLFSGRENQWF
jgi:hypothetical protein